MPPPAEMITCVVAAELIEPPDRVEGVGAARVCSVDQSVAIVVLPVATLGWWLGADDLGVIETQHPVVIGVGQLVQHHRRRVRAARLPDQRGGKDRRGEALAIGLEARGDGGVVAAIVGRDINRVRCIVIPSVSRFAWRVHGSIRRIDESA